MNFLKYPCTSHNFHYSISNCYINSLISLEKNVLATDEIIPKSSLSVNYLLLFTTVKAVS